MLVALAESCIGGNLGVEVELETISDALKAFSGSLSEFFYNETPGRFIVSVAPEREEDFRKLFAGQPSLRLGVTRAEILRITRHGLVVLDVPVRDAKRAWRGESR